MSVAVVVAMYGVSEDVLLTTSVTIGRRTESVCWLLSGRGEVARSLAV